MDNFNTANILSYSSLNDTNILSYSSLNDINKVEFMLPRTADHSVHILWLIIPIFRDLLSQKTSFPFSDGGIMYF